MDTSSGVGVVDDQPCYHLTMMLSELICLITQNDLNPIDRVMLVLAYPRWANVLKPFLSKGLETLKQIMYQFGNAQQISWLLNDPIIALKQGLSFPDHLEDDQRSMWKGFFSRSNAEAKAWRDVFNMNDAFWTSCRVVFGSGVATTALPRIFAHYLNPATRTVVVAFLPLLFENVSIDMLHEFVLAIPDFTFCNYVMICAGRQDDPEILMFCWQRARAWCVPLHPRIENDPTQYPIDPVRVLKVIEALVKQEKFGHIKAILDFFKSKFESHDPSRFTILKDSIRQTLMRECNRAAWKIVGQFMDIPDGLAWYPPGFVKPDFL